MGDPQWLGEAHWFGAARDPSSNALYVARLDDTREVLFNAGFNLLLGTLRVLRCDDSGCIQVATRQDIRVADLLQQGTYPDGAPILLGRRPSVHFDPQRRRVLVGVTSASDLFRPLVLEFDAF